MATTGRWRPRGPLPVRARVRASRQWHRGAHRRPALVRRRGRDGPPLGTTYWDDESRVLVPLEAGARLVNTLTGERLTVEGGGVRLADILSNFPVALLVTPD